MKDLEEEFNFSSTPTHSRLSFFFYSMGRKKRENFLFYFSDFLCMPCKLIPSLYFPSLFLTFVFLPYREERTGADPEKIALEEVKTNRTWH